MSRLIQTVFIYILVIGQIIAQNNKATLTGNVKDVSGKAVKYASIKVLNTKIGTTSNEEGSFTLNIPSGGNILLISGVGYENQRVNIDLNKGETKVISVELISKISELEEVKVIGKSESQNIREAGIKVDVISTKTIQNESATLTEIMNRTAGVRVRQVGGLGSAANVLINGFQGKAVRYFKDGIPLDYLGAGFNINIVPVNVLDRVEIYKGVLPTQLGADALGGAINMVTRSNQSKFLDVSYEIASFNTHRASLNTFYQNPNNKIFIGFDGFYNRSDNNYEVNVKVIDEFTRTRKDATVTRFHDGFTNYYGEIYAGVSGLKWADLLKIGLTYFQIDKQEQHGALMTEPFGQVTTQQKSFIPTLQYKKKLLGNKMELSQFLVLNKLNTTRVDTCACTYDWYGKRIPVASRQGEADSDGSLSNVDFNNFASRTYITYQSSASKKVDFNIVYSSYDRLGADPFGNKYLYSGRDILSVKAGYIKLVGAIGFETKIGKRLINNSVFKYFNFKTFGTDALYGSAREDQIRNSGNRFGFAQALKYSLSDNSFVRFSGEYATRLPENTEVFGDGLFEMSNFFIKPEQSFNLNLGYRTQQFRRYSFDVNTFFRRAEDLIVQVPTNIIFLQHQNVDKVRGYGLEVDGSYNPKKWLTVAANFTYQDLRLFGITDPSTQFLNGSRVRNTPYFFGGITLRSRHQNVFKLGDALQAYWYYNYVNEFYLEPIPQNREAKGFLGIGSKASIGSELVIPSQNLHTSGINYSLDNDKTSIGFEVKNVFNDDLFDNFRVQRAGRSLHLKVRYSIK
ncbi:MAG: carboxypeptidase-like regulatory domain-containing protein [Arcicella sp.]|jgi:outer membrane cobalamin receptor|nr:carboxypeptidase-like regulatory domain-containing protein [Arcicella sp.]